MSYGIVSANVTIVSDYVKMMADTLRLIQLREILSYIFISKVKFFYIGSIIKDDFECYAYIKIIW